MSNKSKGMIGNSGAQTGHEYISPTKRFSFKLDGDLASDDLEESPVRIHDLNPMAAATRFDCDSAYSMQVFISTKNSESQSSFL